MNNQEALTISNVARQVGVNIQTLRYYERIGLLKPTTRKLSGYRVYNQEAVKRLAFIRRAQDLGFTLDEIRELLALETSSPQSRERVRKKASERLAAIREKIRDLKSLERTLARLIDDCVHGKNSGPCPILERMEGRS